MRRLSIRRKVYLDRSVRQVQLRLVLASGARKRARARRDRRRRRDNEARRGMQLRNVVAPERFNTSDGDLRRVLLLFCRQVEQYLKQGYKVKLVLDGIKVLQACGTLVFMARLDCWLAMYPGKLSCSYPSDDIVEELFQHVGVLQRLGLSARKTAVKSDKVMHWHFHSGSRVDPSAFKEMTAQVIRGIEHPKGPLFGDCLNEAISNTVGHAYTNFRDAQLPVEQRKWWIFSQYKDERVFVAIYDIGEGIPSSLRRKPEWSEYLKARQYYDSYAIQSAIESSRTRTRQPERGQGLPEMLEFSKELQNGRLLILSAKGGFEYNPERGQSRRYEYRVPLPGTLVQWAIPFRKGQNDGNHEHFNR